MNDYETGRSTSSGTQRATGAASVQSPGKQTLVQQAYSPGTVVQRKGDGGDASGGAAASQSSQQGPRSFGDLVRDQKYQEALAQLQGMSMTGVLKALQSLGGDLVMLEANGGTSIERVDFAMQVLVQGKLPLAHRHAAFLIARGFFDQLDEVWGELGVRIEQRVREAGAAKATAVVAHLLDWRTMKELLDLLVLVGPDYLSPLAGSRRRDAAIAVVRADPGPIEGTEMTPLTDADRTAISQFANRWRLASGWTFSKEAEAKLRLEEGPNQVFTNGANNECTLGGIFVHAGPCAPEILGQRFDPAKHSHLIGGSNPDQVFAQRLQNAVKIVQQETSILLTQGQFDALVDLTFNRNKGLFHQGGTGRSSPVKDALDAGDYGQVPGAINQQAPQKPRGVTARHADQANQFDQNTPHPAATEPPEGSAG